ncbi:hypothetical protein DFH09DRAFT_1319646 [Mycena vulgaris]|nr:hypothetical protein DFH09DRAFT_1319646 [Mycena vulgaris]
MERSSCSDQDTRTVRCSSQTRRGRVQSARLHRVRLCIPALIHVPIALPVFSVFIRIAAHALVCARSRFLAVIAPRTHDSVYALSLHPRPNLHSARTVPNAPPSLCASAFVSISCAPSSSCCATSPLANAHLAPAL